MIKATSSLLMGTILVLEDGGRRKTTRHQCDDDCYLFVSGKGVIWSHQVEGATGENIRNLGNMGGGHNNQQLTPVPCRIVAQPFWGFRGLFGMLWGRGMDVINISFWRFNAGYRNSKSRTKLAVISQYTQSEA